jgi:hypothetical protein
MTSRKQLNEQALEEVVAAFGNEAINIHPTMVYVKHYYVAFPNGLVSEVVMPPAQFDLQRRTDPRWKDALDVTPDPCRLAVHIALGLNTWWRQPSTPLRCFPCPDCADGSAKWLICETCGGSRRFPTIAWVSK